MRISIFSSIILGCGIFVLMTGGMGWLSLHKQAQTMDQVISLYDKAFEGVNYAHKANGAWDDLLLYHQGDNNSFTDPASKTGIHEVKENLDLANELAFSSRERVLIQDIEMKLDRLAQGDRARATITDIDKSIDKLIGRYTADRIDSRDRASEVIAADQNLIGICLISFLALGIFVSVFMIMAILPPIGYSVSVAEAIAAGKFDNKIKVRGMVEISQLLGALSSMQESIVHNIHQLESARQQAIKSEVAKSEFLANMSHEIRTPLNNIIGTVQLLQDSVLDEKDKELFVIIEKSSVSLLSIVNDILDLSKIEAGEVRLENIGFDIYEKVRDVTQMFLSQASKKGLSLSCKTDEDSLLVIGDPLRFERILTNLVGNALRYTERGGIRVRAHAKNIPSDREAGGVELLATVRNVSPGRVCIRCEVIDTGIGIPKDRQDKIFEKFTQADTSTTRRYGGTGLGLTITRDLIKLMRGKIGVESEVGKGSTFWFEIPLEVAGSVEGKAALENDVILSQEGAIPVSEVRVLVAEDHEINRAFMRRLFESLGIVNYIVVENGLKAVEEVQRRNFDLVLMDCHMPEMNGYDATAEIRGLSDDLKNSIPIVAMTANAMSSDENRCLAAGMNAVITKPFDIKVFKHVLSPWVRFEGKSAGGKRSSANSAPANMEILIASSMGDKEYIRKMVDLFIETAGQQIGELKSLCAAGNESAWIDVAHGLKGTAGIVGATTLQKLCVDAQMMDNASENEKQEIFLAIENEYRKLKDYFSE